MATWNQTKGALLAGAMALMSFGTMLFMTAKDPFDVGRSAIAWVLAIVCIYVYRVITPEPPRVPPTPAARPDAKVEEPSAPNGGDKDETPAGD